MNDLIKQINLVESLSKYNIELKILHEGEYITAVNISPDGEQSVEIPIEDAIYMTEYGTVDFPGTHILQHILYWIESTLNLKLEDIMNQIFERDFSEFEIEQEMRNYESAINLYIKSYISSYVKKVSFLSAKAGETEQLPYYFDLSLLERYIICQIYKKY